ncbi:MAG: hypothetical protein FGM57_01625 [Candidatus Taylorbacteria bacterium]|nr:hypothetical protein [Candidatus Taylorbacteria bacterium]
MDTLEKIFGGAARVKLMRLFLFNPTLYYETSDVVDRSKVETSRARRELNFLAKVGLIKKSSRGGNTVVWYLNDRFPYLVEFQRLLLQTSLVHKQPIVKKISKIGRIKLVVFSGIFKELWDNTIDILVVADNTKRGTVESVMSSIEAEMGKEIKYAILDSEDFKYRLGVGDRLVRDVLDYPHEVVLDKLGLF